jgi:flagellar biosynthetic protein FliR
VDAWIAILLPLVLLMARMAGAVLVLPIFGWRAVPMVVRVGLVMLLAVFFAVIRPPVVGGAVAWPAAVVMIAQEAAIGLAIGLSARLVYLAVQQGGMMAAQQMGFADAGIIDPASDTGSRPIATFLEMIFALLFLSAGAHHLLLRALSRSFDLFPVGEPPDVSVLAEAVVRAGSAMLLFALQLAAPMLAGFLILAMLLCIVARALPEMNILLASFPLRVGMGLFMAAAIMPLMEGFTAELARWMSTFLIG